MSYLLVFYFEIFVLGRYLILLKNDQFVVKDKIMPGGVMCLYYNFVLVKKMYFYYYKKENYLKL